ncbi:MAG: bifunctional oligoribonuclease/PAP phosphatase NrnA [candidate division Zixibacteria bacterium]|nr:bifunctional oligoribonuclease/PAP phosphatase NrnA [candidate division Zixibacteria bacterium]
MAELTQEIRTILNESHRTLVVSHVDPDGDAIGTQLAFGHYLRDIGKEVLIVRDSIISSKYLFLPEVDSIIEIESLNNQNDFDVAVVLECPTPDRMGAVAQLISPNTRIINIDHHPANILEAEVSWVDTSLSSVGEMTFEFFQSVGYTICPEVATQLYTAILTDTGRFRYSCTGPRTLEIAGELVRSGADPREICDHVYFEMTPELVQLTGELLHDLEYRNDGRICFMTLTRDHLARTGVDPSDTEGLIDYTLYPRGVEIGALLRDIEPQLTKISLRSRPGIDVAVIAARFGGGGHVNAAGCHVELPIEAAKDKIIQLLQEARESQV